MPENFNANLKVMTGQFPSFSPSKSTTGPVDFLLDASRFQKESAELFESMGSCQSSGYFTSLWLSEVSDVGSSSSKKLQQSRCPFCGVRRSAENVQVRVKPRKRYSKTIAQSQKKLQIPLESSERITEISDGSVFNSATKSCLRFVKSKNQVNYHCLVCKKTSTHDGISRESQKLNLRKERASLKSAIISSPEQTSKSKSIKRKFDLSDMSKSSSLPGLISMPTQLKKKKKRKDGNAGLIIPPKSSQSSFSLLTANPRLKAKSDSSQSSLSKFLC